jgi:PAS domain S-box-containing protein
VRTGIWKNPVNGRCRVSRLNLDRDGQGDLAKMSATIIPMRYGPPHERGLRNFLETGQGPILNQRIEITALRQDGAEFPVELSVTPLKSGDRWTFSGFVRDISERKRAEEKLRESELHWRQMTETIPEMLWSATPDGSVDYCNARVLDYTGLTQTEIKGMGRMKTIHPDAAENVARTWKRSVESGQPFYCEFPGRRAFRRQVPVVCVQGAAVAP